LDPVCGRRGSATSAPATAALRRGRRSEAAIIGRRLAVSEAMALAATIKALAPDLVLVNTIFAAAILDALPPGTPKAVITHDVFHLRTASLQARNIAVRPAVTKAEEATALRRFAAIIAISESDAAAFRALAPDRLVLVVPPPIVVQPAPRPPDDARCVFLGSGSAHNVDGVKWLLEAVWPLVRTDEPRARLELCGAVCDAVADDEGVTRRFVVADLADAFAGVAFAVNPLRAGSGLKIKMLDYFAHGVPAITTAIGAQGFPGNGAEPFVVCDTAEDFAATMLRWLREPDLVARFAARCAAYAALFSRDVAYEALDRLTGLGATGG
jgi:polysaccharide biosynthesis protein PslH